MRRPHASDDVRVRVLGAVGHLAFDQFVTARLIPTLRPDDVAALDNLSIRKSAVAQQAIAAAGASLVFLPAYSPDFNLIERAFAQLKQHLRAVNPRTVEVVLTATRALYPTSPPPMRAASIATPGASCDNRSSY